MKAKGFTLIECLIGLSLSLLVVCSTLEFFCSAEKHFLDLKDKEEAGQDVLAALDKIRIDVLHGGQGLVQPMSLGLVDGVAPAPDGLLLSRAEGRVVLAENVAAGSVRIPALSTGDFKSGRDLCIYDEEKGEVRRISAVEPEAIILSAPLEFDYGAGTGTFSQIETVRIIWDEATGVLRRQANSSSPQPLLENVESAAFAVDAPASLGRVRLKLNRQGEKFYEMWIFLKNPALALSR
jgi:prepilin-type N-terminal cleavage/methylation domain-containing protein